MLHPLLYSNKDPRNSVITELAESSEHNLFRIVFQTPGLRSYELAADSHADLEAWMKCISRASYDYLRLMVAELQQHLEELEGNSAKK